MRFKDWKTTKYAVRDQRVLFDTMIGYDVVKLTDIRDVQVKTRVLDRVFGTKSVYVTYRIFSLEQLEQPLGVRTVVQL